MRDEYFCQNALLGKESKNIFKNAKITIVGLGGLGSAITHLLVRMGIKTLYLYDADIVSLSNLARQHLYTKKDLQRKKVEVAKEQLSQINPSCNIITHNTFIESEDDFKEEDTNIIIDGTDNFAARKIIDLFSKKIGCPWIHGAAIEEKGTVIVFDPRRSDFKSFEDVYKGKEKDFHDCSSGVIISTTTIIASMQARLAVKILLNKQLKQRIYRFNGVSLTVESFSL